MAMALGHWRTDMHNSSADGTHGMNQSIFDALPADGTEAANWKKFG